MGDFAAVGTSAVGKMDQVVAVGMVDEVGETWTCVEVVCYCPLESENKIADEGKKDQDDIKQVGSYKKVFRVKMKQIQKELDSKIMQCKNIAKKKKKA